ncbi:uncharacterized protein aknad1 [Genypterus blacodes]|uniref:uncharacterized protein aknad1 n=1 Tax=Genypterus blacodes TaxID=154954 RepID=UPI003F76F87A
MEGDPEESDEDVEEQDGPAVLWEKCFQQSIFIDLSEDESLHLSDLESSFAVHLSQAESAPSEASIHFTGAELSDVDENSSECSSEREVDSKTKSSALRLNGQRPDTLQNEASLPQGNEDPGQNTSDEDQDDLPYDSDLGSPYFNHTARSDSDMNSDGIETKHANPEGPVLLEFIQRETNISEHAVSVESNAREPVARLQEEQNTKQESFLNVSNPCEAARLFTGPADDNHRPDLNHLLLRHFSQDELLCSGRLIEAETLPEVSLLESVDETVRSWAPTHNSVEIATNDRSRTRSSSCYNEINQSFCQEYDERTRENSQIAPKASEVEVGVVNSTDPDSLTSNSRSLDSKQGSREDNKADVEEQSGQDDQVQRIPLVRTRSFSEMKYGQGRVHYPQPDFSKVASKVKIPKTPPGPARPVAQCASTMHRVQSSPGILGVISRVLEDSVQPAETPYVFKDQDKPDAPALVDHLQAEYDKLLTRYAEAENLIDQMRLGTKPQEPSEVMFYLESGDHQVILGEGSHLGSLAPHLPLSDTLGEKTETTPRSNNEELDVASSNQPDQERPSDGEMMTTDLREIVSQFMQKVAEFKLSASNKSVSTAEQQMMLRSMMEAQDQLERKYISKKEEHRVLEMQNYMGLSRNTGTFDPNRLVEGDIFRIGMHLEDVKEIVDRNVCEQMSPPHPSSTPAEVPSVKVSPHCLFTASPPQCLHEGQSAVFSTAGYEMERQKEKEKQEEEEVSEVRAEGGLRQSSELTTTESQRSNAGQSDGHSQSSQGSLDGLNLTAEDGDYNEEEKSSALSEGLDPSKDLAFPGRTSSPSRQRPWTAERSKCVFNSCDLADCVSLAVEVSCSADAPKDPDTQGLSEPPLNTLSLSQRIVSPETDSGFGSSYLNQLVGGPFQANLHTDSLQSRTDGLSSSDSEGSCSNQQTTIHSAALTVQWRASTHPSEQTQACGAASAVELWVESITKEPSVMLSGSDPSLHTHLQHHHHLSEHLLSNSMDIEQRERHLSSCSCNSEALLALQSEVSRLKKDLEEGLVQLPHLEQKMDYLTSKYRQERRPKTRSRTHHRSASNSLLKQSSSRQNGSNPSASLGKIEDWISSDLDPSKSKGLDSDDTACSEIMLQFSHSPVGSRRGCGSGCTGPEVQHNLKRALNSNRGSEKNCSVKTSVLRTSSLKEGKDGLPYSNAKQRLQTAARETFYSKERWSLLSSPPPQKPLLQVNYGSSSSLPASYKLRELTLDTLSHQWKRSSQSDSALLPSNVYFQRTPSPFSLPSKTGSRTSRCRGSKEEEMSRTLDQAIEMARSMKRTTDHMAKRLSADLAKAQLHRKPHNLQPLGGRKHHDL